MFHFAWQVRPTTVFAGMTRMALLLLAMVAGGAFAFGQSFPAAENNLDLHVGSGFATASSDYAKDHIRGYEISGGLRLRNHFTEESEFRRLADPQGALTETSFATGVSCYVRYHGISPYVKGLAGIGFVSNPSATLTVLAGGGGVDFALMPSVHVRADYEYQSWPGELGLEHGLVSKAVTVGLVYHIHPLDRPRQY